MKTKIENRRAQ